MEFKLRNDTLTISIEGRITSDTAVSLEKDIDMTIVQNPFKNLVIDLDKLEYTSSAGLRIFLRLSKTYKNFKIINVSSAVYEVFEMTGFTSMFNIEKALRKIDVSNAKVIGEGFFSKVYRLDAETIVKVFIRDTSIEDIKNELNKAKQAFIQGIPTAISYDIVDVNGKKGVVFELLDCGSLRDALNEHPNQIDDYAKKYCDLIKLLNSTPIGDAQIPSAKKIAYDKVEKIKPYINSGSYTKLRRMLDEIPDTKNFVHGDFQIKNIMIQKGEFVLIDMDTLSYGHPLFELSSIFCTYVVFDHFNRMTNENFFGLNDIEVPSLLWEKLTKLYFEGYTEQQKEYVLSSIELWGYVHMIYWHITFAPAKKDNLKYCLENFYNLIDTTSSLMF